MKSREHITEVCESTMEVFNTVYDRTGLDNYISVRILSNSKLKEIIKPYKEDDIHQFLNGGFDIVVTINDDAFIKLDKKQQELVFENYFAGIHFDTEKDKIVYTKPTVDTYPGIINKYGVEEYMRLKECLKSLFDTSADEQKTKVQRNGRGKKSQSESEE